MQIFTEVAIIAVVSALLILVCGVLMISGLVWFFLTKLGIL
jgi:hypothetical protein